jgi:hypothetical protein
MSRDCTRCKPRPGHGKVRCPHYYYATCELEDLPGAVCRAVYRAGYWRRATVAHTSDEEMRATSYGLYPSLLRQLRERIPYAPDLHSAPPGMQTDALAIMQSVL